MPTAVLLQLENCRPFVIFTTHFHPKTLHDVAGYNLAGAMSLSSHWQVNIHFHLNTRLTLSAFDLWEVSLRGIDVAIQF